MSTRIAKYFITSNMIRTLFAREHVSDPSQAYRAHKVGQRIQANAATALFLVTLSVLGMTTWAAPAVASPVTTPQKINVIMIGDRLVDVAHGLGMVPAAMSVRCSLWPLCDSLKSSVQVLGCPNCLTKKKAEPLISFAKQNGIKRVLIERNDSFCTYVPKLQLEKIASFLDDQEFEIQYVDFTQGLEKAVRQTADLLGHTEKVEAVLIEAHVVFQGLI